MKDTFAAPPFTAFASLEQVARNVPCVSIGKAAQPGEKVLEVECIGTNIRWHHGGSELTFPMKAVSSVEVREFTFGPERFLAVVLTFISDDEPHSYRMINSHESEKEWLNDSAIRIGRLLGIRVEI